MLDERSPYCLDLSVCKLLYTSCVEHIRDRNRISSSVSAPTRDKSRDFGREVMFFMSFSLTTTSYLNIVGDDVRREAKPSCRILDVVQLSTW